MTSEHDRANVSEDRVDELARSAGAALRRPAPADGMARVRTGSHRRRTARAVAGGSAVVAMGVGLLVLIGRGSDDATVVTDSGPDTVSTDEPATESTTTTPTTTTPDITTVPATTPPPDSAGWQPATDVFPDLAFIPCCGTDWEGEPSPAVPTDPAAPLPAGIYNARPVADVGYGADIVEGVLPVEVRAYTKCDDLAEFECSGDPPYADTALGVASGAARTIDVVLDDSARVAVFGFACEDEQLRADEYVATGTDLTTLLAELDASYETAVREPMRRGVDPAQLADELAAEPTAGFFDPGCPSYTDLAWEPASGPTLLVHGLYRLDAAGGPEPLPPGSVGWIIPTAISVDEQGAATYFFYAGFLS